MQVKEDKKQADFTVFPAPPGRLKQPYLTGTETGYFCAVSLYAIAS